MIKNNINELDALRLRIAELEKIEQHLCKELNQCEENRDYNAELCKQLKNQIRALVVAGDALASSLRFASGHEKLVAWDAAKKGATTP